MSRQSRITPYPVWILFWGMLFNTQLTAQDSTWTTQSNPLENGVFYDASFINDSTGWAVGFDQDADHSAIIFTTTRGTSWESQISPLFGNLEGCHFVDSDTGYAVGQNFNNGYIALLKTGDGGANWETADLPLIHGVLEKITFVGPSEGWAVGQNMDSSATLILHTEDGTLWTETDHPEHTGTFHGIFFTDPDNGWIVGADADEIPIILHTEDGGQTWMEQNQPVSSGVLMDVFFIDSESGWASGRTDRDAAILRTTDGGANWEMLPFDVSLVTSMTFGKGPAIKAGGDYLSKIMALYFTAAYGLAVLNIYDSPVQFTTLLLTLDGGLSWMPLTATLMNAWIYRTFLAPPYLIGLGYYNATLALTARITMYWLFHVARIIITPEYAELALAQQLVFTATVYNLCGQILPAAAVMWALTGGGMITPNLQTCTFLAQQIGTWFLIASVQSGLYKDSFTTTLSDSTQIEVTSTGLESRETTPGAYRLRQNYPNPFNPKTVIPFEVKETCRVTLKIYDLSGREALTLVDDSYPPGKHQTTLDDAGLPSGVYFYEIRMNGCSSVRKMVKME